MQGKDLVWLALSAVVGLLVAPSYQVAFKGVDLASVCANRQVQIIHMDAVKQLFDEAEDHPELCPMNYLESIDKLKAIVLDKKKPLCGEQKFAQIADYHFRYIKPKQDGLEQEAPVPLQQFFQAWALQVSGLCKKSLVDNVSAAVSNKLNHEDIQLIDQLHKAELQVTNRGPNFAGLVYMPELDGSLELEDDKARKQTTKLDLRDDPIKNKLMHECQPRFKPIYSKLVVPIVRMAKLGYDYVGPEIDSVRENLEKDSTVRNWLMLTSVCESLRKFELVEAAEEPILMEQIQYEPENKYNIDGRMWIWEPKALRKEFDRMESDHKSTGFNKFLSKAGAGGRKLGSLLKGVSNKS